MALDKEDNSKRMKNKRVAQKEEEKEEERKAIVSGVVAQLSDKLPGILMTIMSANVQHNKISGLRKVSCGEEAAHPVPLTPPGAIRTGGTRGRRRDSANEACRRQVCTRLATNASND